MSEPEPARDAAARVEVVRRSLDRLIDLLAREVAREFRPDARHQESRPASGSAPSAPNGDGGDL